MGRKEGMNMAMDVIGTASLSETKLRARLDRPSPNSVDVWVAQPVPLDRSVRAEHREGSDDLCASRGIGLGVAVGVLGWFGLAAAFSALLGRVIG